MSDPNRFKFHGDEHYLKSAAEMRSLFGELPEACDNTLWIAERADVEIEFGKPQLPNFPLPEGFATDGDYLRHLTFEGATRALGRAAARRRRRAPGLRAQGHRGHGLQLVLPHRVGPHRPRPPGRHPGRARAGQRGRLRGGLHAAHHRPRPDQVRPAVRAVPQPVPHLDARHRHGLRLPLPGRDDPLRGRALRPRPRRPDRDVLHDQGPGRGARRRPGAGPPVHRRRQGGQGHAAADHGPRHAAVRLPRAAPQVRGRLQDGRRAAGDVRGRPRHPPGHRRGQGARGAAPPGRHPRRRGGDHQGAAHRVPADPAQARERRRRRGGAGRHPVRDARRRGAGPPQDGLPRPAQPRRHHRHHRGHPRRRGASTLDIDNVPLDDAPTYELLARGDIDRRVPARGRADAGADPLAGADVVRGRRRPRGALPAGPDGGQHAQRLRRPEERPQAGRATCIPTPRRSWATPRA